MSVNSSCEPQKNTEDEVLEDDHQVKLVEISTVTASPANVQVSSVPHTPPKSTPIDTRAVKEQISYITFDKSNQVVIKPMVRMVDSGVSYTVNENEPLTCNAEEENSPEKNSQVRESRSVADNETTVKIIQTNNAGDYSISSEKEHREKDGTLSEKSVKKSKGSNEASLSPGRLHKTNGALPDALEDRVDNEVSSYTADSPPVADLSFESPGEDPKLEQEVIVKLEKLDEIAESSVQQNTLIVHDNSVDDDNEDVTEETCGSNIIARETSNIEIKTEMVAENSPEVFTYKNTEAVLKGNARKDRSNSSAATKRPIHETVRKRGRPKKVTDIGSKCKKNRLEENGSTAKKATKIKMKEKLLKRGRPKKIIENCNSIKSAIESNVEKDCASSVSNSKGSGSNNSIRRKRRTPKKIIDIGTLEDEDSFEITQSVTSSADEEINEKQSKNTKRGRPKKRLDEGEATKKKKIKSTEKYCCSLCSMAFHSKIELLGHQQDLHEIHVPHLVKCELCNKLLFKGSSLRIHNKMEHGIEETHTCVCQRVFTSNKSYKNHKRTCDSYLQNPEHALCSTCGKNFKRQCDLTNHLKYCTADRFTEDGKERQCPHCDKSFERSSSLKNHVTYYHNEPNLKCPFCDRKVKTRVSMLYHVSRHTEIADQEGHASQSHNPQKMARESPSDSVDSREDKAALFSLSFECPLCTFRSDSNKAMKAHVLLDHAIKSRNAEARFGTPTPSIIQQRRSGKSKATARPPAKAQCYMCGLELASKASVKHHIAAIHEKVVTEICDLCGESFYARDKYLKHRRLKHDIYLQGSSVPRHLVSGKPKPCKECGKMVTQMKKHMDIHKGIYRFQCKECGKACRCKYDLQVHMRRHTGEKPYSCAICNSKFSDPANLKHHNQRVHKSLNPEKKPEQADLTESSSTLMQEDFMVSLAVNSIKSLE